MNEPGMDSAALERRRLAEERVESGNALYRQGKVGGAIACFESALVADATYARAHYNLGVLMQGLNRSDEAIAHYEQAVTIRPEFAAALVNWGNAVRDRGDIDHAFELYSRGLAADPEDLHALNNLASLIIMRGQGAEARERYQRAVASETAQACVGLGNLMHKLGRDEEAIASYESALALDPRSALAHYGLGVLFEAFGRREEAIDHYRNAIASRPDFSKALSGLANALAGSRDRDEALALSRRALTHDPHDARTLNNLAAFALEAGRLSEAEELFTRALESQPPSLFHGHAFFYGEGLVAWPHQVSARFNLGLIALFRQEFEVGWEAYELRFDTDPPIASIAPSRLRHLAPSDLAHARRLAVRIEQGLGEQVMFSTLLPELVSRGIDAVVETNPGLIEAYERSLPSLTFIPPGQSDSAFGGCDFQVPIGSLPRLFRRSSARFSSQPAALLVRDRRRRKTIEDSLPPGTRIGIAWRGDGPQEVKGRAIPLARFASLGSSGAQLIDLQQGDADSERRDFDAHHPGLRIRIKGLDEAQELDGLLAAIEVCDLVITPSNLIAHLAGSIGKRTWLVYLGGIAPFHYWVAGPTGRSLWYPAVEIVTDPAWSTWELAFEVIGKRLRNESSV